MASVVTLGMRCRAAFRRDMLGFRWVIRRFTLRPRLDQATEVVMRFIMDDVAKIQRLVIFYCGSRGDATSPCSSTESDVGALSADAVGVSS